MTMIELDGASLTIEQLLEIADRGEHVALSDVARARVRASRAVVDRVARSDQPAYGINTGFGSFADVRIAPDALEALQVNLLRSHAAGVGDPLPVRAVRATMALRANVLAKGFSGISVETLEALIALINKGVHPAVPSRGSVGASGDLAPLAHLSLVLIGEGEASIDDDNRGERNERRENKGSLRAQRALRLTSWVPGAESLEFCGKVQDAYSLRCAPQVHGATRDGLWFVRNTVDVEANSATDNPMVFADSGDIVSCGNFHGAPIALAADLLAAAVVPLATISERRTDRLVDPTVSGLPAFLTTEGGVRSGYMLAQVTAAAVASELKTLAHPAGVDTIPTSANKEDHVSMSMTAALKAEQAVSRAREVIAIEILCACQAIDLLAPLETSSSLKKIHALVRSRVPTLDADRAPAPDIAAITELIASSELEDSCGSRVK